MTAVDSLYARKRPRHAQDRTCDLCMMPFPERTLRLCEACSAVVCPKCCQIVMGESVMADALAWLLCKRCALSREP